MDMENGLSGRFQTIGHHSITGLVELFLGSNLFRCEKNPANNLLIGLSDVVKSGDVLLGEDQDMERSLRIDVVDGYKMVIFINLRNINLPTDHFAEKAITHSSRPPIAAVLIPSFDGRGSGFQEMPRRNSAVSSDCRSSRRRRS